jgi:uncharacterized protein
MNVAESKFAKGLSLKDELVRRIRFAGQPVAIVLFGSEARNEAHADSDLDILIIEAESSLPRYRRATAYRAALLDLALNLDRDIDVLVYTSHEINEWANVPNAFVTTALREGKVLYENPGGSGPRLAV